MSSWALGFSALSRGDVEGCWGPLAGAEGDAPQDASVVRIDDSEKLMAMGLALLPEWGKTDPQAMGRGTVDECVRSLVVSGANPDKIALLDNFY